MTYHDAEVLAAVLDALGHRTELLGPERGSWRVVLTCGCDRDQQDDPCPR